MDNILLYPYDIQQVNELKKKLDSEATNVIFSNFHPHAMANVLKIYLKELPEPLFTSTHLETFLASKG